MLPATDRPVVQMPEKPAPVAGEAGRSQVQHNFVQTLRPANPAAVEMAEVGRLRARRKYLSKSTACHLDRSCLFLYFSEVAAGGGADGFGGGGGGSTFDGAT